jgi:hypothetical protein
VLGPDTQCSQAIDASYVCLHSEPRPKDYQVRHRGRLHIEIWLSGNAVKARAPS